MLPVRCNTPSAIRTTKTVMKLNNTQTKIREELDKPGLRSAIAAIKGDQQRRLTRSCTPSVVTTTPLESRRGKEHLLDPLPGSIFVFWAHQGSELIPALERAYATGDESLLNRLSKDFSKANKARKVLPLEEATKSLIEAPVQFDLEYAGKTLVSSLALADGIEFGAIGLPYNGAPLNDADFRIVERHHAFARGGYDILVVKTPPELTDIERATLEALPEHKLDLSIGDTSLCPGITVAVLIVVALVTCANGGCTGIRDRLAEVTLSDDQIRRLGTLSSATELLAMRREVFEEFGF